MAFKSGEKYTQMQEGYQKELRYLERIIKGSKEGLEAAYRELRKTRNQWFEVFEDLRKEYGRKLDQSQKLNEQLE